MADTDIAAARAMPHAYEEAWSAHDARAIAGFYHEPSMRVGQAGPHVRATRAMQETFFAGFLPGLVTHGYACSRWETLAVKRVDANTAFASGVVVRYRADDSVIQHQGVTYGLWRGDDGWRIFLSSTHPPEAALPLH